MTNNQLTDNQLTKIIESAEAVISALAGTNEDVHPNNSTEMCRLYDWLNDNDAPPEVVLAMARELQERRKPAGDPVAWTEKCEITNMQATGLYLRGFPDNSQGRDIPLYAAPPVPVVKPVMFIDDISASDADKLAATIRELNKTTSTEAMVVADTIPSQSSNDVNDAAWKLHDMLTEHGPLNGGQFNNLKECFYEALKVAMRNGGNNAH